MRLMKQEKRSEMVSVLRQIRARNVRRLIVDTTASNSAKASVALGRSFGFGRVMCSANGINICRSGYSCSR
jgi:hypothetical protein